MELEQCYPRLVLFMPDHVHALMAFADDNVMKNVVRNWKRYTGRHLHIGWQRDFFDHRIRSVESLNEKWQYILDNPIRAGLAATPEEWPYLWTGEDLQPGSS